MLERNVSASFTNLMHFLTVGVHVSTLCSMLVLLYFKPFCPELNLLSVACALCIVVAVSESKYISVLLQCTHYC